MNLQIQKGQYLQGLFVLVVIAVIVIVVLVVRDRVEIIKDEFIRRFFQWLRMNSISMIGFEWSLF